MDKELESMRAITDCMDDLDFNSNDSLTHQVVAVLNNPSNKRTGVITVTFNSNWHSGDGPYLDVDDAIRSFGINHTNFKPKWQKFTYSKEKRKMEIRGNDYNFELTFK